jgi:hypothetical protein
MIQGFIVHKWHPRGEGGKAGGNAQHKDTMDTLLYSLRNTYSHNENNRLASAFDVDGMVIHSNRS